MYTNERINSMVKLLTVKDNTVACGAMNELLIISEDEDGVYEHINEFIEMTYNSNSYIRTRGLLLIARNARWDENNVIDTHIDSILSHIEDAKPITSRQFIMALPLIIESKPALKEKIILSLHNADISFYKDSMQPLVRKDIDNVLSRYDK